MILSIIIAIKSYLIKSGAKVNFVTRITPAEFEKQKKGYTNDQINLLKNSSDYKFYKKVKGGND